LYNICNSHCSHLYNVLETILSKQHVPEITVVTRIIPSHGSPLLNYNFQVFNGQLLCIWTPFFLFLHEIFLVLLLAIWEVALSKHLFRNGNYKEATFCFLTFCLTTVQFCSLQSKEGIFQLNLLKMEMWVLA
jgi:hypothetical protein